MATTKWTARDVPSQNGRTALVTGANSGIGFQTALELARAGAHVVLGCRSSAKGQQALDTLLREAPAAKAEVAILDMASLASVRSLAQQWNHEARSLDLLINNAGVMALPSRDQTPDGFERQFATNHLGHFALTGLLVPALLRSSAPRVVTVASLAHRNGKMEWDNLQSERRYQPWNAYNNSKLANILFARELQRRVDEDGGRLLSTAVHPGVSRTSIIANGPGVGNGLKMKLIALLSPVLMQPDSMGALPTLYGAASPELQRNQYIGPDGFMEMKGFPTVVQPRPQALDEAAGKRLWEISETLTGVIYPKLTGAT